MTSETIITERIKYFQIEYPDGVPLNILKLELDLSVEELQKYLLSLEEQGILFIENEEYVKMVESIGEEDANQSEGSHELASAEYRSEEPAIKKAETYDLTEKEISALKIIKDLTDESGHIPRYMLEGSLLYGDLKMNTLGVYNLIMSLENKGIIKKIQIKDNEYYSI
jgi:uncharacterized protein with von Willebrand factor type A (vWA) domain